MTAKDLVREGAMATFFKYIHDHEGGRLYYTLNGVTHNTKNGIKKDILLLFPIPVSDLQYTTIESPTKAINLVGWINKAIDEKTLINISPNQN